MTWTVEEGRCEVCGDALGTRPYIMTRAPHGEHSACRDWSQHPFPPHLDRMLVRLRRIRRTLKAALDLVDETGKWLAEGKRRWPDRAEATFSEATLRRERVRAALTKLVWPSSG